MRCHDRNDGRIKGRCHFRLHAVSGKAVACAEGLDVVTHALADGYGIRFGFTQCLKRPRLVSHRVVGLEVPVGRIALDNGQHLVPP